MSIHVLSWVLRHSSEEGSARLVLLVLADHAHEDGAHSYPAVDTIRQQARLKSRSTVQRHLRGLAERGAIVDSGLKGPKGQTDWSVVMGPESRAGLNLGLPDTSGGGVPDLGAEGGRSPAARTVPSEEPSKEPPTDPMRVVWEHYQRHVAGGEKKRLTPEVKTTITRALDCRPLEAVLRAIVGLSISPHHNGRNDTGATYLAIRYAIGKIKQGESVEDRIDKMAALAPAASDGPSSSIAAPEWARDSIREALSAIRKALANPGNMTIVASARESLAWLRSMGVQVEFTNGTITGYLQHRAFGPEAP